MGLEINSNVKSQSLSQSRSKDRPIAARAFGSSYRWVDYIC